MLPERLLYWRGPLRTGEIVGRLATGRKEPLPESVSGFGWKAPTDPGRTWNEGEIVRVWSDFLTEMADREVSVVGIDSGIPFNPPLQLRNQIGFPGFSDGKAWELLFFLSRFRNLLRNYRIPARKARAAILWEEGNLGLTCARLIANELRFLTLITPQSRLLERAGDQILAESGISAQLFTELNCEAAGSRGDWPTAGSRGDGPAAGGRLPGGARILIVCGRLRHYQLPHDMRGVIRLNLFQPLPSLTAINIKLPLTVASRQTQLPLYPALGETVVRCGMKAHSGFWCGPDLPLERVLRMGILLKELGLPLL